MGALRPLGTPAGTAAKLRLGVRRSIVGNRRGGIPSLSCADVRRTSAGCAPFDSRQRINSTANGRRWSSARSSARSPPRTGGVRRRGHRRDLHRERAGFLRSPTPISGGQARGVRRSIVGNRRGGIPSLSYADVRRTSAGCAPFDSRQRINSTANGRRWSSARSSARGIRRDLHLVAVACLLPGALPSASTRTRAGVSGPRCRDLHRFGFAHGHGRGLDSQGGHYNRKTGQYHFHRESSPPSEVVNRRTQGASPDDTSWWQMESPFNVPVP